MSYLIHGLAHEARTQSPLTGATVLAFSVDHPEPESFLGKGETDAKGAFKITYRRTDFVKKIIEKFPDGGSDIFLTVTDRDGDEVHRTKAIKGPSRFKPQKFLVEIPRRKPARLGDVVKSGGFSSAAASRIEQSGIADLQSLLRMKAAGKLGDLGLARADQEKLGTVARLAALGGNAILAGKMLAAGLTSPARLLRLPATTIVERIERQSGKLDDEERAALSRLQRNVRRVKQRVGQAGVLAARQRAADKDWKGGTDRPETVLGAKPDDDLFPKDSGGDALCRECDQCESIFSPTAYAYDLLTFIEDGYGVEPGDVGKIVGQELNLDCETALAPIKQIVLGVEVLERYAFDELSITAASLGWRNDFQNGAVSLLAVIGIDAAASPLPSAHADLVQLAKATSPTLSTITALREKALTFGAEAIEAELPLPAEPPASAGDEAEAAFAMESAQVDAERATRLADQKSRIESHVDQLLVRYRQALIERLIAHSGAPDSARALEQNLFIDVTAAPCQLTSRILQIIQSLQSVLLSVRAGSFDALQRTALQPFKAAFDEGDLDEESWVWLKTYRSWNAAIYALVYTENILSPPVERKRISGFFRDQVVTRLLRGQASAGEVEALDEDYAAYFRRIAEIRPIASHVIGDRLFIFARTGGSGDYALWQNIVDTRDLYVPGASRATMRDRPIDASGWFEVPGWNPDQQPRMVMPFGEDDDLGFVVLGSDRTYKLAGDGRLDGEVAFEAPPGDGTLTLSAENTFGRQTPTLWVQDENDGWHRAELNETLVEWNDWIESSAPWFTTILFTRSIPNSTGGTTEDVGHADTLIGHAPCRVGRLDGQTVALSYDPNAGTTQPFVQKRLNGLQAGQSFGSYTVLLSWMRSSLDLPGFLVVRRGNGDLFVQAIWLNTVSADPSFMLPTSLRLDVFADDLTWPASVDADSAEGRSIDMLDRYLYYPLLAGWALNRAGDFVTAHDCYRRLYDPFAAGLQVFPFDKAFDGDLERGEDWLATIHDPDAIARQRTGAYLRHVVLMMVKNLIDWADHQFTLSTPESLNRAKDLYRLAETVLDAPSLRQDCAAEVTRLERQAARRLSRIFRVVDDTDPTPLLPAQQITALRKINDRKILETAVARIDKALTEASSNHALRRAITNTVDEALKAERARHRNDAARLLERLGRGRQLIDKILDHGIAGQKHGGGDDGDQGAEPDAAPPAIGASVLAFCVPKNPLLAQLALHIATRQILLANCLDINGEPNRRPTLPTGSLEGRVITTFGQLAAKAAGPIIDAPHYRYSFLIEKARQYTSLAQQLEAMMLAAIEKRDAAALATLQAEIAEELADATVNLKALAREEVEFGIGIAVSQLARAETELDFWTNRTSQGFQGLNTAEQLGMGLMAVSGGLQGLAAAGYILLAAPQIALGVAGGTTAVVSGAAGAGIGIAGLASTPATNVAGLVASAGGFVGGLAGVASGLVGIGAALVTGGQTILSGVQAAAGAAGTFGNLSLTFASFERRFEDWQNQLALAGIDLDVAGQQLALSEHRVDIALQDEAIAELQQGHARLILEFHKNRFSNEQLYQWMIGVLQGAYRDVMQHATATARLAQRALMFERQEEITEIGGDYWSIDEASLSEDQRASGLLGAERLLTAITRLDAWKIKTDKRRLQLAKTFSLAHSFPSEFVQFKETGRIQFHTLMDWFDQDYPGHYLRLIKSVRVAVIALVSPLDGIHATLSNDGFSSVVKPDGAGTFVKLPAVQRLPQQVALDAAGGDNGLFVLDYNDPLLLPFEGLGVETGWSLDLPRAANSFNYDSLVDVLVTIEYTAVPSAAYRQQVIARFGTKRRVDRVLSLRDSFPDHWYHLHNPLDPSSAQTVTIDLPAYFFQQSKSDPLGIRHMMIILGGEAGASRSGGLKIAKVGITPPLDVVTDADGIFNSRNGAPLDPDGLPKPRFALDPNDATRLIAPGAVGQTDTLLDPRGEWQLTFDPAWFAGNEGDRDIDRLTDIILIPTLEYEVSW